MTCKTCNAKEIIAYCSNCRGTCCVKHVVSNRGRFQCVTCFEQLSPKCSECGLPSSWECARCRVARCVLHQHHTAKCPECTTPAELRENAVELLEKFAKKIAKHNGCLVDWETISDVPQSAEITRIAGEHHMRGECDGESCSFAIEYIAINPGDRFPVVLHGKFHFSTSGTFAKRNYRREAIVPCTVDVEDNAAVLISRPFDGHPIIFRFK